MTLLEFRLGVQLVRRKTRRLIPTPEGEQYAAGALSILQQKTDLEEGVSQNYGELPPEHSDSAVWLYPAGAHTPRRVSEAIDYLRRGLRDRLAQS